ncbi:MAG: AAA family ATPase, partial [Prevotellaceae bacterium]|nr:AAA family ATPase [Prevotellaceae bacterium]
MIQDYYTSAIREHLGFEPTREQAVATSRFADFLVDRSDRVAMIIRGSAGTGKTTLAGAIVRTMMAMKQKLVLLAPTGRAAKVFAMNAGMAAFTIHKKIYRQKTMTDIASRFTLNANLSSDTLFIVDEASMIANMGFGDSAFGSGCLLDDLIQFVYSGRNCRMLLIGDTAQLPPVGEEESPALMTEVVEGYGLNVYEANLNEVLRQSRDSGILYNATQVRQMITSDDLTQLPKIDFNGFSDIVNLRGDELIEQLASSYSH